jgi:hypothetical protein
MHKAKVDHSSFALQAIELRLTKRRSEWRIYLNTLDIFGVW